MPYRNFWAEPEGKNRLWRTKPVWGDKIKMDFKKFISVVWNGFVFHRIRRVADFYEQCWNLQVHKRNCLDQQNLFSLSERTLWHVIRFCILPAENTRFSPSAVLPDKEYSCIFMTIKWFVFATLLSVLTHLWQHHATCNIRCFSLFAVWKPKCCAVTEVYKNRRFVLYVGLSCYCWPLKICPPTCTLTCVSCVTLCIPSVCSILRRRLKCISLLY